MSVNEELLYVALYARGGRPKMPGLEDTYHWSLIIESNTEKNGIRFHAKETMTSMGVAWQYEATSIPLKPIIDIFQSTPIRAGQPGREDWNCVEWVKEGPEQDRHMGPPDQTRIDPLKYDNGIILKSIN